MLFIHLFLHVFAVGLCLVVSCPSKGLEITPPLIALHMVLRSERLMDLLAFRCLTVSAFLMPLFVFLGLRAGSLPVST